MCRLRAATYPEPMTFTVVRAVREAAATIPPGPSDKLHRTAPQAMPMRPLAMDLPRAEELIRLDFDSADFAPTTPGGLA